MKLHSDQWAKLIESVMPSRDIPEDIVADAIDGAYTKGYVHGLMVCANALVRQANTISEMYKKDHPETDAIGNSLAILERKYNEDTTQKEQ